MNEDQRHLIRLTNAVRLFLDAGDEFETLLNNGCHEDEPIYISVSERYNMRGQELQNTLTQTVAYIKENVK